MYDNYADAVEAYDDMLNECHDAPTIAGIEFDPCVILRRVDPIAYRCGFNDWLDGEGVDSDTFTDDWNAPN